MLTQPFHRSTRLRHLHQGNHSLLHSRPAARRKNNQRKFSSVGFFDRNRQFFSLSTSHAAHHEISAEFCTDRRNSVDPPDSRDTSLRFLRDFTVLLKLPVIPGKTQRIFCLQTRRKLFCKCSSVKERRQVFADRTAGGLLLPHLPETQKSFSSAEKNTVRRIDLSIQQYCSQDTLTHDFSAPLNWTLRFPAFFTVMKHVRLQLNP